MWLGHASFLMQLGGENVLIDPVFSTQIGQRFRRHVAPPLAPEQLPQIDTVLITQSRPDHLDPATIARLPRSATVLAPRGLGPWFCRRLFARIIELDWWDRVRVGPIEYTFVPAGNGAGASVLNVPRLHGGGFVIESEQASIYYAGDTARAAGFGQIGRRFPGLAAALLPVGGNRGSWLRPPSRLTPRQVCPGVRADRCPDAGADALGDVSALQRGVVCAGRTAAGTLSPGAAAERMPAARSDDRCQRAAGLNWSRPIHPVCV